MTETKSKYRYYDFFAKTWRQCRCTVLDHTDKTARIRLDEFGPRGCRPGTVMRVHLKSLDWKLILDTTDLQDQTADVSWHAWTDI